MTAHALVALCCPNCNGSFIESARFVREGASAWCPECRQLFELDGRDEAMRRSLEEARLARLRRRERRNELRRRWADPVPAPAERPIQVGEVLRVLDGLLERIDDLRRREA